MDCKQWKDEWVAHLYGELEPAEERALHAHLDSCSVCRERLEQLGTSRELLRDAAPHVPAPPRVVVLQPRRSWSSLRSFAAGAACAVMVFGLGLFAGPIVLDGPAQEPLKSAAETEPGVEPATADKLQALQNEFHTIHARLARLEGNPQVTPSILGREIENLERRLNRERVRDLEQVLDSLTASELRTGTWMDQTDTRLTMLALSQNPRFIEQ